ncbi:SLATT domain-containing protein [Deinococcus aquatilis]|uniref:SLATT domain-containing protein n=1 Tax=Deinococcus aquatilis TaxID=519440 RepID=UPI0003A2F06D|nr:SLATT domain-containing protein [Deinococcus aquatilis]
MATYGELFNQIAALYGRTLWSHKVQEKQAEQLEDAGKQAALWNQIVSGITTTSLVLAVIGDSRIGTAVGGMLAALQFVLALHLRDRNYPKLSANHTKAAHNLWVIREQLMAMITDMRDQRLTVDEARAHRDRFLQDLEKVYADVPKTTPRAFTAAKKSIDRGDHRFEPGELEQLIQ